MQTLMHKITISILFPVLSFCVLHNINAQENQNSVIPFEKQNKNKNFKAFAAGMRLSYGNNKSLLDYIRFELPDYYIIPEEQKIPDFNVGYEFFGEAEYQLTKHFSLKADYSYSIKSLNSTAPQFSNYDFSVYTHNILLTGYYIIPGKYYYLKLGGGTGLAISELRKQTFGLIEEYNSTGINVKLESVLNTQISNSIAAYIGVFLSNSINATLKNGNGEKVISRSGEEINLNSFNIGLGLGLEIFIF